MKRGRLIIMNRIMLSYILAMMVLSMVTACSLKFNVSCRDDNSGSRNLENNSSLNEKEWSLKLY